MKADIATRVMLGLADCPDCDGRCRPKGCSTCGIIRVCAFCLSAGYCDCIACYEEETHDDR